MFNIAKEAKFIIMCVVDEDGFNENDFRKLDSVVLTHRPDAHFLLSPKVVEIFYLYNNKNLIKHKQLKILIEEMISKNKLSWLYGESIGSLIAEFSIFGKLKSMPAGIAINHALQNARVNKLNPTAKG